MSPRHFSLSFLFQAKISLRFLGSTIDLTDFEEMRKGHPFVLEDSAWATSLSKYVFMCLSAVFM